MEIQYSEVDTTKYETYWGESKTQPPQKAAPKKKKVSFDDILSNMNLVVNPKGELQFMSAAAASATPPQPQPQYQQQPILQVRKQEPLDPSVKHSYIYNKYFKDYQDDANVSRQKIPKTKEEYRRMILERIITQQRIAQVKSKKLIFPNSDKIQATNNQLKKMSFH